VLEGGDAFWAALGNGTPLSDDVAHGDSRLIALFRVSEDWTSWEMHPAGDELVYVVSGAIELVLEESGGPRTVALPEKTGFLVPRGVWHTANSRAPSDVPHVTPGSGTQTKPR
jgi:mannose-6-phosphate isomerase-like protein (cupin superfamily)